MEHVFYWFLDIASGSGWALMGLFLIVILVAAGYSLLQKHIDALIQDVPSALLIVEARSGQLLLSNNKAIQLLGIRRVGKFYLLPETVSDDLLVSVAGTFSSLGFNDLPLEWNISKNTCIKVTISGRKTVYRRQACWLLYVSTHQASHDEREREIESLSVVRSALDNLSELVFIKDNHGQVLSKNKAFERFWGERVEEGSADIEGVVKGRANKRRWTTDSDGRSCLLETYQNILLSSAGEKLGSIGISHDVTDWHLMQKNLREEMDKRQDTEVALAQRDTILHNILESSPDSIGIFNENMVYQACNKPFVKALGISDVDDLLGKRLQDVIPEKAYSRLSQTDQKVLFEGVSLRFIDQVINSNGDVTWYEVVKSPFRDPASGTNGVLILARDVSERYLAAQKLEQANQELERLSFMDSLTQIANRRRFDEQLATLWPLHVREAKPLSIMLCDIDYFKGYNDYYGHQLGDEALVEVARVFKSVLFRSSDCVARYGGEEFGFILPNTTATGATQVAEKIHDEIARLNLAHQASEVAPVLTVSIGLATVIPVKFDRRENLIALADSALYQAKANGRNQTCVHHTSEN
ncbi:diguanylate cyclase domain-containing protein [Vibrio ostreicida]|uniref:diguanylate cyclase n=1 Tax=Vibrio ostreicida TaxID=526588 RepID=A0ABT8BPT2_9VIBR|nr:diguanylate cyclase [Vibrio ostreicida]MDN3609135.1 diguanylate cyclase [Vibrio ostreicida]NPD08028.1 diguanylate cyclase [Vibrio ostreicida]